MIFSGSSGWLNSSKVLLTDVIIPAFRENISGDLKQYDFYGIILVLQVSVKL
jgi:hypothetical protein